MPTWNATPTQRTLVTTPLGKLGGKSHVSLRYDRRACEHGLALSGTEAHEPARFPLEVLISGAVRQSIVKEMHAGFAVCDRSQSPYFKGDFNFDGHEDFEVWRDGGGPYGTITSWVFVFVPDARKYVEAPALSALTEEYMGSFEVDARRKRLIASSKSGCCIHFTSEFTVERNQPVLQQTETITHTRDENGGCFVTTELTRPHRKNKTSRRPCTTEER